MSSAKKEALSVQFLISMLTREKTESAALAGYIKAHVENMKLSAESILIHQCDRNAYEELSCNGHKVRCYHFAERGVGLSRNNALMRADADISVFADEDIVYEKDAAEQIRQAFVQHPEADMLLFNVKVAKERRTYWNDSFHRVRWYNCGRYPAYSFALRTGKMHAANVSYSLLFGGGARFSNGEDSLFISDCLKAGLKVYAVPVCIGEEIPRPSTWFFGYNEKFFYDRGVLYHYLYKKMAPVWGLRFMLKMKSALAVQNVTAQDGVMPDGKTALTWKMAWSLMLDGIRDARKGI